MVPAGSIHDKGDIFSRNRDIISALAWGKIRLKFSPVRGSIALKT